MNELDLARNIALSLEHLKISLGEKGLPHSDREVLIKLNQTGSNFPGWEQIKPHRFNDLRHGRDRAKIGELYLVLQTIEALLQNENLSIAPAQLERRYWHKLPQHLAPSVSKVLKGEELGDAAELLSGPWQFFYWSPINREKKHLPEFRSFGVFIPSANRVSRTADFFVVSGHSRWEGEAFVNQSHVYLICSDINRTEGAFFLMSKPKKGQAYLTGIGTALEREVDRPIRPAIGFVCFGQKWTTPKADASNKKPNIGEIITQVLNREQIKQYEEEVIRQQFCQEYTATQLRKNFGSLYESLQQIKINGDNGLGRKWLYFEWPD